MRPLLFLVAVSSLPLAAASQWTVDDILLAERAAGYQISSNGKLVVWVKSQMDRDKGESVSHLMLRHLADDYEIQLTRGTDSSTSPRFSPDAGKIAFLSARRPPGEGAGAPATPAPDPAAGPRMQVWLLDTRGGEPYVLTRFEKGVRGFGWIDKDTLLITAAEDSSLHEQRIKERKDTAQIVEDERHEPPVRLFRFDLKSREAARLTTNTDRITRLVVSPDGAWAVTSHNRSLRFIYDQKIKPAAFLHDLKKATAARLFADGKLLPTDIAFSPDSKGFYFSAPYTSHPIYNNAAIQLLYYHDLAAGRTTPVPLDWENGLSAGFAPTPDGFLALLANGARHRAARYTRGPSAWTRAWIEGDHAAGLAGIEITEDGRTVVYRYSTASVPEQLFTATLDGPALKSHKSVTSLNGGFRKKPLAKTELVYWKGARDERVEGILYYPHNYQPGRKHPLVVMIHGGPHGADTDHFGESWGEPHQLLAQRGAFILKPNYHGSALYGLAWGESISGGNYNELEWIDVERGVDSLIARGLADPDKLGVMGWSNGSIITIELTTRTTRYKVASAGAGDVNWISDWGNCVFGHSFDDYYIGGTPLDNPQLYIRKSPLFRMDKVVTPTIIFFGTEDKQVPTEQGWQHFRALQHHGKTDVRFILFPGEAHGPRKYVHQRRKVEEEMAWFDKYLFGTAGDRNEALKPDSPLSAALERARLGAVPATVARGEIEIGRFEIPGRSSSPSTPLTRSPTVAETTRPAGSLSKRPAAIANG